MFFISRNIITTFKIQGIRIKIEKKLSMNIAKMKALNGSIKISGEEEKERQAYILEDKPKIVKE